LVVSCNEPSNPGPEHAFYLHQIDVHHVAGVEAGDPHGAPDAYSLRISENDVDRAVRRQEPGAVARHPDQRKQREYRPDHNQTDPNVTRRRPSAHQASLHATVFPPTRLFLRTPRSGLRQ
jgi:hypothetical protein